MADPAPTGRLVRSGRYVKRRKYKVTVRPGEPPKPAPRPPRSR